MNCRQAVVLVALALAFQTAVAQDVGTCESGRFTTSLDVGGVDFGGLYVGSVLGRSDTCEGCNTIRYPRGVGEQTFWWLALVATGWRDGQYLRRGSWINFLPNSRAAGFWPGPIPADGSAPVDCERYDRVWKVSRDDVARFEAGEQPTEDLEEWPIDLGAPVADGDGISGNYDLMSGDRPAIVGDQMAWWIMNDRGNVFQPLSYGSSRPLNLEVRVGVSAFRPRGGRIDWGLWTMITLRVTNRGTTPLLDGYLGFHSFLGECCDKYMGTDSTTALAYAYRPGPYGTNDWRFGSAPPAVGIVVARGPRLAEPGGASQGQCVRNADANRAGLAAHVRVYGGRSSPRSGEEWHNVMQGRFTDGRTFAELPSDVPESGQSRFFYPGQPETSGIGTEFDVDGAGNANQPGQRETMTSTGPFCLDPGESEDIAFAFIWAAGADELDSVRWLRYSASSIREVADRILQPLGPLKPELPVPAKFELGVTEAFPNPFERTVSIDITLPIEAPVSLDIFDLQGRLVHRVVDRLRPAGRYRETWNAGSLPSGVYVARVRVGKAERRASLVKID